MIAPPPQSTNSGDSDSDWDDDDDFAAKKINIKIKPIAQVTPNKISASVDELRATVGTWKSLANINLVKPNSRRHHQSTVQLINIGGLERPISTSDSIKLPVAIAIQECLNATLIKGLEVRSLSELIGHIKMAVPPTIYHMEASELDQNLEITLVSSISFDKMRLNREFVHELDESNQGQPFVASNLTKRLSIDMRAVQAYVKKQYQIQPNNRYFILPELVKYGIGSQERNELSSSSLTPNVNPIQALSHWLCDLNITKFRVDIQSLDNTLKDFGLTSNDIINLKISMHVNGGVVSYQSKPDANWNPLDSKLTWSFTNLTELVQRSTLNGVTSCLARFDLNDGPSTPSDVSLQFSIAGKSISGSHVILNNTRSFCLARQKFEVRTGTFRCRQPSI